MNSVHREIQQDNWHHKQDDQWYNWNSRQDTQRVGKSEAPLDGASQWPPDSIWYCVASVLLTRAPMEDWDWMVHWILLKRHYRQWVPICQTRRHALPGTVGWVFLSALKANTDSTLCDATPMCNVETLGRAIAAYIGVRARTPRPWRSQHLWQRGGKWQWWWTSWDRGSLLGSQASCAAGKKVKCEQPKAKVGWGVSSRDPNVTEFMTYRPYSQVELADLGKQVQQTHRKHLEAWLLWLWDTGWARHLRGFAGPYWEKPWRRKWQPHSSPLSWKIPSTE